MAPNFEALSRLRGAGYFLDCHRLNDTGDFLLDRRAEPLTQKGSGGGDGEEVVGQQEVEAEEEEECGEAELEDLRLGPREEGTDTGSMETTPGWIALQAATPRKSTGDREAGRGRGGKNSLVFRIFVQIIVKFAYVCDYAQMSRQYETIQKYCKTSEGERQLEEATEDDFKRHMWHVMRLNSSCADPAVCPILHVWFARDRGGNYGFVEMASVEEAHAALRLDGMLWHGLPIRINRPTDWKNSVGDESVLGAFAGTSGLALAESLAAAAQQATVTGNDTGLVSLIASLPEDQRAAALDLVARHRASQRANHQHVDVIQSQIQADLLSGQPSRVVRIACPSKIERDEEYDEILSDILAECNKYGHALAALIIRPELEQLLPSVTVGDVYLEYASCIQADHIILTFSGRMYDGKPLQLQRFNELAWRQTFHQHATPLLNQVFEKALEGLQPANVPVTADVGVVAIEAAGGDKDKIAACTAGAAAALAFLNSGPQTTSRTSTQVPYGPQPQPQTEASSEEKNCKDAVGENDSTTQDPENHIHDDGSVTCGTVGRVSVSTTCSE
uniref:Splicing factor U2AF 65 kDa subunit, putative n=1 Tax=Toxoplasma gondii (strain ATCC 50861 / VEG) TaxID=432359 RepID=A0A0F7VAD8_TOXGV|nr:TPA: splicing factor U2AF 65 kDa subunit, putative [Toxoplasma gondii VEG]